MTVVELIQYTKTSTAKLTGSSVAIDAHADHLSGPIPDPLQVELRSHGPAIVEAMCDYQDALRENLLAIGRFIQAAALHSGDSGTRGNFAMRIERVLRPARSASEGAASACAISEAMMSHELSPEPAAEITAEGETIIKDSMQLRAALVKYHDAMFDLESAIWARMPAGAAKGKKQDGGESAADA